MKGNNRKRMKANAPEKIYLRHNYKGDIGAGWLTFPLTNNSVEYTRTDAFIEKAAEYLMDYEFNDSPTIADRRKRVEEFKKAMKL